jgi:hypothetical protein
MIKRLLIKLLSDPEIKQLIAHIVVDQIVQSPELIRAIGRLIEPDRSQTFQYRQNS